MDRIENLAHVLRKRHNIHTIDKHIKRLLIEHKIIRKTSAVHATCINRNKPDCTFAAKILAKDNLLGEDITIMIKPDHSEKRRLRVLIQVGSKIFQNFEQRDKPRWNDKKVFKKELYKAERDIWKIMEQLKAA